MPLQELSPIGGGFPVHLEGLSRHQVAQRLDVRLNPALSFSRPT
jgi:hypothetical protein